MSYIKILLWLHFLYYFADKVLSLFHSLKFLNKNAFEFNFILVTGETEIKHVALNLKMNL